MKIGLYIQDRDIDEKQFDSDMKAVKRSNIDLLVFPEVCTTRFSYAVSQMDITNDEDFEWLLGECVSLSKELGKAIVFCGTECYGAIFSLFVNPFAAENETPHHLYIKHTATASSAFEFYDYDNEFIEQQFSPILFKGHRMGITICYDCNHAGFSRAYKKFGDIDILINCTGGNVDYYKWYRYNKVRALENNCIDLCTMGYERGHKNTSYTFGFSPTGAALLSKCITEKMKDSPCGIYVYNTEKVPLIGEKDIRLNQKENKNKSSDCAVDPYRLAGVLSNCKKINDSIYVLSRIDRTLVFIIIDSEDILKPEILMKLIFSSKLSDYQNKRYIVINRWDRHDQSFYENVLSDVFRVRTMENFCVLIYISPELCKCYQTSLNKMSQIVSISDDGCFHLDLKRATGPEGIGEWKKDIYRKGYEKLIEKL